MRRHRLIQPQEVFAETGYHYDCVVAQYVSPRFENESENNIGVVVLKLSCRQLRLEMETLLADGLQSIMPRFECDERRGFSGGIVNELAPDADGEIKRGRRNW